MKTIDCSKSLHELKLDFQKAYMAQQCEQLAAGLETAIHATRKCAPIRLRTNESYFPERTPGRTPVHGEARWEEAMWMQWHLPHCNPVANGWKRIHHYQTMLRDTNSDTGWGEVDLIGSCAMQLPVIIEIKTQSRVTPAEMLVQAAAYGIAVQMAWGPAFARDWGSLLRKQGIESSLPAKLESCHLVGVAPRGYWSEWISSISNSPRAKTVSHQAWTQLENLRTEFNKFGLMSSFFLLDHDGEDQSNRPVDISAVEVEISSQGPRLL